MNTTISKWGNSLGVRIPNIATKHQSLKNGDILLNGHTHVPKCTRHNGYTYMNCGSASIPKEDSPHSYMTLQDGVFRWKDLVSGEEYMNTEA